MGTPGVRGRRRLSRRSARRAQTFAFSLGGPGCPLAAFVARRAGSFALALALALAPRIGGGFPRVWAADALAPRGCPGGTRLNPRAQVRQTLAVLLLTRFADGGLGRQAALGGTCRGRRDNEQERSSHGLPLAAKRMAPR